MNFVKQPMKHHRFMVIILLVTFLSVLTACSQNQSSKRVKLTPTPTPTHTPAPPAEASVKIVEPEDGATVDSKFKVIFEAEGLTVEPSGDVHEGAGHFHILVDTDFTPDWEVVSKDEQHLHYGDGSTEAELELEPGEHTLRLQFADGAHIALAGEAYKDEITITVE